MDEKQDIEAERILMDGGIVIYPTDTAYGIGCRIDSKEAVTRLFAIRKRPPTKATPVLVASKEMAMGYFDHPSSIVIELMDTYWPGALTIVNWCLEDRVYELVRGGTNTIGLRQPNHNRILSIIVRLGVPILGPSANFHTMPTPYKESDLDPELRKLADFVISGECPVGAVSTVVDCTRDPYTIIRRGAIAL